MVFCILSSMVPTSDSTWTMMQNLYIFFQSELIFCVIFMSKHPALIALRCIADKRWGQTLLFPLHTWHCKVVDQSLAPVLWVHWILELWAVQQCIILIDFQGPPFPVLWALTPVKHHLGMCFEMDGSQVLAYLPLILKLLCV